MFEFFLMIILVGTFISLGVTGSALNAVMAAVLGIFTQLFYIGNSMMVAIHSIIIFILALSFFVGRSPDT